MPIHNRRDKNGPYFQWGNHGKKYYYIPRNPISRAKAKALCMRQARAIIFNRASRG